MQGRLPSALLRANWAATRSAWVVVETERQVEAHLQSHMDLLPAADTGSRAIVAQMKADEIEHAQMAMKAGAAELPAPVKSLMKVAAKLMTTVAHRI